MRADTAWVEVEIGSTFRWNGCQADRGVCTAICMEPCLIEYQIGRTQG